MGDRLIFTMRKAIRVSGNREASKQDECIAEHELRFPNRSFVIRIISPDFASFHSNLMWFLYQQTHQRCKKSDFEG